jgi:hypothetical protein
MAIERANLESFLYSSLSAMDDHNLQSFQASGEHSPFGISKSRQIFGPCLAKDTSCKLDKVAMLVHRTDRRIAIQEEFPYRK